MKGIKSVKIQLTSQRNIAMILEKIQGYPSIYQVNWNGFEIPNSIDFPSVFWNREKCTAFLLEWSLNLNEKLQEGDPSGNKWLARCDFYKEAFNESLGLHIQSYNKRLNIKIDYNSSFVLIYFSYPSLTHKEWMEEIAEFYEAEIEYEEYENS